MEGGVLGARPEHPVCASSFFFFFSSLILRPDASRAPAARPALALAPGPGRLRVHWLGPHGSVGFTVCTGREESTPVPFATLPTQAALLDPTGRPYPTRPRHPSAFPGRGCGDVALHLGRPGQGQGDKAGGLEVREAGLYRPRGSAQVRPKGWGRFRPVSPCSCLLPATALPDRLIDEMLWQMGQQEVLASPCC